MKTLLTAVLISVCCLSIRALADEFPYDSQCRRYNATSETVKIVSSTEVYVLCKFGLNSYIESHSVTPVTTGFTNWAVQAYRQNNGFPYRKDCFQSGSFVETARDSKGRNYNLCVFGDGSIMEELTFENGPNSGYNTQMDWELGIH